MLKYSRPLEYGRQPSACLCSSRGDAWMVTRHTYSHASASARVPTQPTSWRLLLLPLPWRL
jgi:hypothetical protein